MAERQRRLIYHRDLAGTDWFEAPLKAKDLIWDFVGRAAGTHVDTFVLHVTYDVYPSKLEAKQYVSETGAPVGLMGDHATWAPRQGLTANSWRRLANKQALFDQDIDPVQMLLEAAHEAGMDFFAGIRMNDVHHAQWDWHPRFWVEHPEFRIGDQPEYRIPRAGFRAPGGQFQSQIDDRLPAALDYTHDEVRAYMLALIEEMARAYDVQGIELDFTRHPLFFKPSEVEAGRGRMTEFVAAVRKGLNRIGGESGRRLVLEARVPPTVESCWRIGLDVRSWMAGRHVDILTVAPYWHPDFNMPVEEFVDAADGTGCKVFASFEFAEFPALESSDATAKVVRAAALAYWKAGAEGMHVFNPHVLTHYLRQEMPFLSEIGDARTLEYLDKHYMATRASNYDDVAWFSYPKELPAALDAASAGVGRRITLKVGDDLEKAISLGIGAEATLRIRVMGMTPKDRLEFKFNGVRLSEQACQSEFFPLGESKGLHQYSFLGDAYFGTPGPYHWLSFRLGRETLPRVGTNEVEVRLLQRNLEVSEDVVVNDVELIIEYPK